MRRVPDGRVTARIEHAFMAVIPADTETPVTRLAEQLENLPGPLRLADAVTRDDDDVADAGYLCGSVHTILLDDTSMPRRAELAIGTTTDSQ
jgi:hypothetical protein